MSRFEDIYDEHVSSVYAFFSLRVGSQTRAEDLTQATFERALKAWPRFDSSRSQPRTWLIAIAKNVLIDDFRRRQTRPDIGAWVELDKASDLPDESDTTQHEGLDEDLADALAALSQREREVLALRFGADLDGRAIADQLDLSVANVQQILSRTLRKLQARLHDTRMAHDRRDS